MKGIIPASIQVANIRYIVSDTRSTYYPDELRLREEVLRKPLGMTLATDLKEEESSFHLLALEEETVVGTMLLTPLIGGKARLRQAAVDIRFRKRGIGSRLVKLAERLAAETEITDIVLHARREAQNFYERLGYFAEGDGFTEISIPHRLMRKRL